MNNVGAGIVLYNPEIDTLKKNIDAIYSQVDYVVLVDNGSTNVNAIHSIIENKQNLVLIMNLANEGIAKALNQIMVELDKQGMIWGLTLDQDSICPNNIIQTYKKYMDMDNLGIICPMICDRNNQYVKEETKGIEVIEQAITSGALTNIDAWKQVGGFDEKMFIDFVDFEFCMKLTKNQYKIVRANKVQLSHQLGNLRIYKFLGREIQVTNHSSTRCRYYIQNVIYCYRKHPDKMPIMKMIRIIFEKFIKVIVFEKSKLKKMSSMFNGIKEGINL